MKIMIASDHAGYELKEKLKTCFSENIDFEDYGTHSAESVDYPDYVHPLAALLSEYPDKRGIIICGTGNGVAMTANKHPNVRAALCWEKEIAELARKHNDANILALPARFISFEKALEITDAFLNTSFEGGRHQRRIEKINLHS